MKSKEGLIKRMSPNEAFLKLHIAQFFFGIKITSDDSERCDSQKEENDVLNVIYYPREFFTKIKPTTYQNKGPNESA